MYCLLSLIIFYGFSSIYPSATTDGASRVALWKLLDQGVVNIALPTTWTVVYHTRCDVDNVGVSIISTVRRHVSQWYGSGEDRLLAVTISNVDTVRERRALTSQEEYAVLLCGAAVVVRFTCLMYFCLTLSDRFDSQFHSIS